MLIRSLALLAATLCVIAGSTPRLAHAQIAFVEGADLSGQSLGSVGFGDNTVSGTMSTTISFGGNTGDPFDSFSFTVPPGLRISTLDMTITNFSGSGALAIYPGVEIVGVQFLPCTATSGTNALLIPSPGSLVSGAYSFTILTGLSPAVNGSGDSRSFNYVLRLRAVADIGACCNRWTGHCAVMGSGPCGAIGLRYDGFATTCSPATCRACPADFNGQSSTTVQDIFDFLTAWFAGCP